MNRGLITLSLFCFFVGLSFNTLPAYAAGENIVFVCAGTSTKPTLPQPAKEKPGFFARLFGFGSDSPTVIVIECSQGKLPEPVAPPTKPTAAKKETGVSAAIRRVLAPQTNLKTATTTKIGAKNATISKPISREEQLIKIEKELRKTKIEVDKLNKQVALFKEKEKQSLYWGTVRVTLRTSRSQKPEDEIITITVNRNAPKGTRVPLSTFRLADGHGEVFTIPGGTKLPIPGLANEKEDIVLEPGQTAIISTGSSPNGLSFMTNLCTGYFNKGYRFNPGLPTACPIPFNEKWVSPLPPQCWDYIKTIRRCQIPYPLPLNLKPECQEAVAQNSTYNACINTHKGDKDFYKNEWRLFLGRRTPIFENRYDSASLLDAEGKVVWYQVWY